MGRPHSKLLPDGIGVFCSTLTRPCLRVGSLLRSTSSNMASSFLLRSWCVICATSLLASCSLTIKSLQKNIKESDRPHPSAHLPCTIRSQHLVQDLMQRTPFRGLCQMLRGDAGLKVLPTGPHFHRGIYYLDSTFNAAISIGNSHFPSSFWNIGGCCKGFAAIFHKHLPVDTIAAVKEGTGNNFQRLIPLNCTGSQMITILRDSMFVVKLPDVSRQTSLPPLPREGKKHIGELLVMADIDTSPGQFLLHFQQKPQHCQ